jgi:hypothetical protein
MLMDGTAFVRGDKNGKRRPYTMRKLCSNIEEHEATPNQKAFKRLTRSGLLGGGGYETK